MEDALHKKYKFDNFADALAFVNEVAEIAEELNHHPDIKFGWGYVEVWSFSHDKGAVTERDEAFFERIAGLEK